jgi:hypothetical protein
LLSDADIMRSAWGARCARTFPLAELAASGALMPFGTDAPVESADPWRSIAAAVTRRDAGWSTDEAFYPESAISLDRALRGACLDGPRSAHIEDQGHLGIGARADLLVVPADMFDAAGDPDVLCGTRPLATVLDGEIIHRSPEANF